MISDCHRIVVQRVHYQHHRVRCPIVFAAMERFQRRALDRVAGVNQQQVWLFFAGALDQGCDLCEPAVVRFVCVVVDGIDIAVQISRTENGYLNSLGRKAPADEHQREHDHERREGVDKW